MATIKVYAPTESNSGTHYRDVLVALGHSVTLQTTAVGPGSPTGFDLLVTQQEIPASQAQTWIDAGKPILVVDDANQANNTNGNTNDADHLFVAWDLASAQTKDRYFDQIYDVHANHYVTAGVANPFSYLNSGRTVQGTLHLPLINGGALVPVLATGDQTRAASGDGYDVSGKATLLAIEKGLIYKDSSATLHELPVRIGYIGGSAPTSGNGNPTGFSVAAKAMVGRMVNWCLGLTTAVDPVASFYAYPSGSVINPVDTSVAVAPGATIVSRFWSFNDGAQTSQALAPTFVSAGGTYSLSLTVWDSKGNSNRYTQPFEFGPGASEPPYELPEMKAAGRILIRLERSIDWTGVAGVVEDTVGGFWLDYNKLPKPGGGTECRWKYREISDGPNQNVRTLRLRLILDGLAGSLSSGASSSAINRIRPGGSYSAAVFGGREVLIQVPLADPDSTDPEDWLPRFHGYLDDPLAATSGFVDVPARDVASRLQFAYRGRGTWIGTEGYEILLGDAIQRVLDVTTRVGLWTLKVEAGLSWGVDAFQMPSVDDVLEFINSMARNRGANVRWWPDPDTGRFQLYLFVLQADKVYPDITFGPDEWTAGEHGSDTTNVRTERTIEYYAPGFTDPIAIYRPATQAQIDEYGLKSIVIGTDQTKHIKNALDANVMLDYVDGAVLLPATVGSRVIEPSDPTIEVNSLLAFEADSSLSTDTIQQYVGNWTEREDISDSGEIADSITVQLRNVPTGPVEAWLRGIAGVSTADTTPKLPPTWQVLKWVTYDPVYSVYTGTAYWILEPHGMPITETRTQTKLPGRAWSEFGPPTRGPGDYSAHFQRLLGNYEYETDVELDSGGLLSSIGGDVIVEGVTNPITMFEINLDADNDPEVTEVIVTGLNADVKADDDSLSVHVTGMAGTASAGYSSSFDSERHTFAVPVPGGATWELEARSRNTLTAATIDKVSAPYAFSVTNSGEPSISIQPNAPSDGSGVVTITNVQATSAPAGYTLKMFMSYQTYPYVGGAGSTFGEIDVTSQLSPSPLGQALPTAPTTYSLATDLIRDDADATETVLMQFRVEIVNGSGITVFDSLNNPSLTASWGI